MAEEGAKVELFENTADIEPMFPRDQHHELANLVGEVLQKTGALSRMVHPIVQRSMAEVVRIMNSYYSNLIEGHRTNPYDIEKALKQDFSEKPEQKDLQLESVAHIKVQNEIKAKLSEKDDVDVYSSEFICWIHEEFYKHLPERFMWIKDSKGERYKITSGRIRQNEVCVGKHIAPHWKSLQAFLARFNKVYSDSKLSDVDRIISIAASHHRFSWIHPFDDGNGRIVRLMSDATLQKLALDANGLWTLSRGLARKKDKYYLLLDAADQQRRSDYDGRGRMSDSALFNFCFFFLETAVDQIGFMTSQLELDGLENRIGKYLILGEELGKHTDATSYLLFEALRKGEYRRGEAARITNKGSRMARDILKACLERGLLVSESEKGPVRLALPTKVLEFYFPLLYPQGIDQLETGIA